MNPLSLHRAPSLALPHVWRSVWVLLCLAIGGLWCLILTARAQVVSSTWEGNAANWSTPSEWSPSDFYPNNGNGGNTFDATINSGTATLTEAIAVRNLTMTGGAIAGSYDLALTGDMTWSGGTLTGSGTLSILSGHALNQSNTNGNTLLSGGRTLTNAGTANIAGTVYAGANSDTTPVTIDNTGTLNLAGSIVHNYAPFTLTNSGTVTLDDNAGIYGGSITNTGTIQKITGAGTAYIQVGTTFDNTNGTVAVSAGTLYVGSAGNYGAIQGTYQAGSGAALNFASGTFTLGTHTFSGAGSINLTGGELQLSGTPDLTGLNLIGGTVSGDFSQAGNFSMAGITLSGNLAVGGDFNLTGGTLTGTVTPVGDFNWTGGNISGSGTQTIAAGHTLNQSNTTYLSEGRTLVNDGTANIAGPLRAGANFGSSPVTVNNTGTINLTGTGQLTDNYATFALTNSGTISLGDEGSGILGGSVINTGTIQRIAGTGTAYIQVGTTFDNTNGTVSVSSGTLYVGSVGNFGAITGTFHAGSGAALNFASGTFTFGTHTFSGAGSINLTGGELQLSGTPDLTGLNLIGGTVSGDFSQAGNFSMAGITLSGNLAVGGDFNLTGGTLTGTVTPVGDFNWTGGIISGSGTQTIAAGHILNQSNAVGNTILSGGRTLANAGTANIAGNFLAGANSDHTPVIIDNSGTLNLTGQIGENFAPFTLTNSGTVTLGDNAGIYGGSVINTGTIQKITGAGTATIDLGGTFSNSSSGTINVQSGTLAFAHGLSNAGILTGSGTLSGVLTILSGGQISPGNSPGTLTFASGLTLDDGSILNFDLGTVSDAINVSGGTLTGSASVGGITLNVTPGTGFGAGSYYLLYGTSFSSFQATDFVIGTAPSGYDYAFSFDGSTLALNFMASAIPEPGTWTILAGLTALIAVVGRSVSRKKSAAAGL